MEAESSLESAASLELADAYLAHLDAGGVMSPEAFLAEQHCESPEALALLRTLVELEGEDGRLPLPGEHLGPYRLFERLGRGGMGVVYRAEDPRLSRTVAVKVCRRLMLGEVGEARFRREAQALAALRHPHVVQVYDFGETKFLLWYAMELVDGRSLESLLVDGPWNVPFATMATRFAEVAEALAAVHAAGLVHRDVKPANLLLRADERLVLADFGVVHWDGTETLTSTKDLPGTPAYMAPEQALGDPPSPAADQYALAAVLYQAIVGDWPLRRLGMKEALGTRARMDIAAPSARRPDVPPDLEAIVLRALAIDPSERHPSMLVFADLLRGLAGRDTPLDPWVGRHLGPYTIRERLGAGGMGTVYRAEPVGSTESVAVKILHPHRVVGRESLARVRREAEAGALVNHPNVLRTLGCDVEVVDGHPAVYIVLEYVPGRTLRQVLAAVGPLPEALLREIARQACAGLAAIHAADIVHRDVKPDNLMIDGEQRVRIMDLGVVALAGGTTSESFVGSLRYAAPEQLEGRHVGPAADLYALGITLYELAAGRPPFAGEEPRRLLRQHLQDPLPLPLRREDPIGAFCERFITTLAAKAPGERFSGAAEAAAVLAAGESGAWWQSRANAVAASGDRGVWPEVPVRRGMVFVGREEERAWLRERFDGLGEGKGAILVLEGEMGSGKSRLVDAFLRDVAPVGARALYTSLDEDPSSAALLESVVPQLGGGDPEARLQLWLADSPGFATVLAAALRASPGATGEGSGLGAVRRALRRLVVAFARARATIWIVEDVDRADEDARETVLALARAAAEAPFLLVLTTEPGGDGALAPGLHGMAVERRTLARMDVRALEALVVATFGAASFAATLAARLLEVSEGLPFLAVECLRGLVDRGDVERRADGSWASRLPIDELQFPEAGRNLVAARLAALAPLERQILEVGAVQGRHFDPDLVARSLGLPRLQVLQVLAHLERRTRLVHNGRPGTSLDLPALRAALLEGMDETVRAEGHAALAEARLDRLREAAVGEAAAPAPAGEDAVFVAEHHVDGARPRAALPHLAEALRHLRRSGRLAQALLLVENALLRLADLRGTARVRLELERIACLVGLGRMDEADTQLARARKSEGPDSGPPEMLTLRRLQAERLVRHGRLREARPWAREAHELARSLADQREVAATGLLLAAIQMGLGESEAAHATLAHALVAAERSGDDGARFDALVQLAGASLREGSGDAGLRFAERALSLVEGRAPSSSAGHAHWVMGRIRFLLGRLDEARESADAALQIGSAVGDRRVLTAALELRARLVAESGDDAAAAGAFDEVRLHRARLGDEAGRAVDEVARLEIADRRGEIEVGAECLAAARAGAAAVGSEPLAVWVEAAAAAVGGADAAAVVLRLERVDETLSAWQRLEAWAWLFRATGDAACLERARAVLASIVERAPAGDAARLPERLALYRTVVAKAPS